MTRASRWITAEDRRGACELAGLAVLTMGADDVACCVVVVCLGCSRCFSALAVPPGALFCAKCLPRKRRP